MRKAIIIILYLGFANLTLWGQVVIKINQHSYEAKKSIGLVAGISGFQTTEIELGVGFNFAEIRHISPHKPKPFMGLSLSVNMNPTNKDLIGQSLSAWFNGVLVFGVSEHYYKNNDYQTYTIKPFTGIELFGIMLIYGRNIFLNDNQIKEVSKHVFTLRYYIPVKIFN
ncbi:MAG: hypothetical protein PHW83_11400 [Bacteroidales bacterium]|nr:hypothetical protein [Bacteroidales bacterium]